MSTLTAKTCRKWCWRSLSSETSARAAIWHNHVWQLPTLILVIKMERANCQMQTRVALATYALD